MNPGREDSILPLRVDRLSFEANGATLLHDLSFEIPRGGITVLIGANGAGKSLTLRLCHGLLAPTRGALSWRYEGGMRDGHKRHMMVFQRPIMLRRSVRANLAHALNAVGARDQPHKIEASLERFGLRDLAERPARLLSGGEQQRLAIARAWSLEPEVLFLDEPSAQLDPGATRQIEQIIRTLADEGMTIVMTSHDLGQVRRLASRVLFLHRGCLLEDADATTFFAAPSSEDARAFLAGDLLW